jgi:hypothetical protein
MPDDLPRPDTEVEPESKLHRFADGLIVIDGPIVRDLGMPFTTRMTVVVLVDGSLWVESPVALDHDTMTQLTELGPIRYLVSSTQRHVWRLEAWSQLFPDAELWAAPRTLATVRRQKLPMTGTLSNAGPPAWATDLDQVAIEGSRFVEETWFFHKPSRTLIVGDIIQVHDLRPGHHLSNVLKRAAGVAGPDGGCSLDIKASFWNRKALRESVHRVLDWDFDKLIVAHGPCLKEGARPFVDRALAWVRP